MSRAFTAKVTAVIFLLLCGATTLHLSAQDDDLEERNKQTVLLAVELTNSGRYDQLPRAIAADYRRHSQATPDATVESLEAFVALLEQWDIPFSDVENKVRLVGEITPGKRRREFFDSSPPSRGCYAGPVDGRWFGRLLSWYPPYWGTGIKVRMASDYSAAEVRMPLRFYNRNYFGTHFGGSLYSMVDPIYALLLANRLGEGYSVWDQAAQIEFVRPGRGLVRAAFEVGDDRLTEVRQATASGESYRPVWPVEIVDIEGQVVSRIRKTLSIRRRS